MGWIGVKQALKQLEDAQTGAGAGGGDKAATALENLRVNLSEKCNPNNPQDALLIALSSFAAEFGRVPAITLPEGDELNWIRPVFSTILINEGIF